VEALVRQAIAGDARAASRLYAMHFRGLFRTAYFMTGDRSMAEDVAQEAFARALAQLDRFDPERGRFSTWVHSIAQNVVRKLWRSSERRGRAYARIQNAPEPTSPDPEGQALRRQRFEALKQALQGLPEHLREAFVLIDIEGVSPQEAAARLGLSAGNLRVRAHRARTQVRALLRDGGHLPQSEGATS